MVRDRGADTGEVGDLRRPTSDGAHHDASVDWTLAGIDADALAGCVLADRRDLHALVDVTATHRELGAVAPDDGVVTQHRARRVVQRRLDRVRHIHRHVQLGAELRDLVAEDQPRVDTEDLVGLGALALHTHRRIGMGEREVTEVRHHHVEVEVLGQAAPQLHRALVEPDALGRAVVRADDGRVATRTAGTDVVHLKDRDVLGLDAVVLDQVVRRAEAVRTAADDDDVVRLLHRVLLEERASSQETAHETATPSVPTPSAFCAGAATSCMLT